VAGEVVAGTAVSVAEAAGLGGPADGVAAEVVAGTAVSVAEGARLGAAVDGWAEVRHETNTSARTSSGTICNRERLMATTLWVNQF
jgi:hypothetical protein